MEMTEKDFLSVAYRRLKKEYGQVMIQFIGLAMVLLAVAVVIDSKLATIVAGVAVYAYFVFRLSRFERKQKALAKDMYTAAKLEGVKVA